MFNSTNTGYSLADIAAATGTGTERANDDFGGNGAWWIIILFLFIFMGNGRNGLFGSSNTTASGVTDGYILTSDFANIERKIDGVDNGLCSGFYTEAQLINGVNDNINSSQSAILNQMNNNAVSAMQDTFALQTSIGNNLNSVTTQLNTLAANEAAANCQTRQLISQNFADLNYNMATQDNQTRQAISDSTTAILANQDANTRSILDYLTQDKISTLESENQALRFAASQQAQNSYLVHALSPNPVPAYTVPNPYTGTYGYSGCTCNTNIG